MENICEFCSLSAEVKNGNTPSILFLETKNVIVIKLNNAHYIVIPKHHILTMSEVSNELMIEMMSVVTEVATRLCKQEGGCQIYANLGTYQDVEHLHWHVALKGTL